MLKFFLHIILLIAIPLSAISQIDTTKQITEKKQGLFRDPLDNKLDISNWLLTATGFVPLVQLITEPSLGYFGLVAAPIFLKPNKHQIEGEYTPPNITVGAVGYTANNTWAVGAIRIATLPQYGIKYRFGGAYTSVNMDFYRTNIFGNEHKYSFNFKTIPVFANALKRIGKTHFYVGLEYIYANTTLKPTFEYDKLPDFITEFDFNSILSSAGILFQFDSRDNLFTPNKGFYFETDIRANDNWTGSDYTFQNVHVVAFKYFKVNDKFVSALRGDFEFLFNKAPFYVHPGINLRGVPMARYQGNTAYTIETEQRYDFTMRWSGVAFGGLAKAMPKDVSFQDALLVYNYGVGFRYLVSRLFGLRMGIDVAWSNNDFGYYVTFGSAWKR